MVLIIKLLVKVIKVLISLGKFGFLDEILSDLVAKYPEADA